MASRLAVALFTLLTVRPSQIARAGCDPQFFCETVYPAGPNPHGLVVSDFNADGISDIAVVNAGGSVTVHFGNGHAGVGDGTFSPAVSYAVPGQPFGIAAGDFNADGIVDLVTSNIQSGTVSVLLGQGVPGPADGTFAPPVSYTAGSGAFALTTGDFNHDGVTDLAVTLNAVGRVAVLLGRSEYGVANGTFGPPTTYAVGSFPAWLAARDLNSDGILDLAVAVYGPGQIAILNGLGTGGVGNGAFGPAALNSTTSNPYDLRFADFNGDGIPDVAVSGIGGLSVSFGGGTGGAGDGTFGPAQNVLSSPLTGLEVADLDRDGVTDLAAAGVVNANTLRVLLGNAIGGVPNGQFTLALTRTTGNAPIQIARGDFNSDGRPDLAIANYNGSSLSVLLNLGPTPGPPEAAGWNENGVSLSSAGGDQTHPRAVSDGEGGAIAVWEDRRGALSEIYAQRVSRSGSVQWSADGIPVSVDSTSQTAPRIAGDGNGGAWVGWLEPDASSASAVRIQHLSPQGALDAALPPAGLVVSAPGFVATDLTLSSDGSGGVLVAYTGAGADASAALYCQRIAGGVVEAGWPLTAGVAIAGGGAAGSASFTAPDLSPDGAGGAAIAWRTRGEPDPACGTGGCAFSGTARIGGSGTLLNGNAFRFPEDDALGVPSGAGAQVIATQPDASDILARRIGPSGAMDWRTQLCTGAGERQVAAMTPQAGGGAIAVWTDRRAGDWDLYASRVASDGSLASGWPADGHAVCVAAGDQVEPQVVAAAGQGLTVCWVDRRAGSDDVYALQLDASGGTEPGWPDGGRPVCTAAGERGAPVLVQGDADGAIVIWQDERSGQGDIYAQRIPAAGLVDVDPVSAAPTLALVGARPNPARGVVWAAFSLRGDEPASLELFDLAGRRILARHVEGMGAGAHLMGLNPGVPLPAGFYVLRLRTTSRAISRQVIVTR